MTGAKLAQFELSQLGQRVDASGMRGFHLPIEDDQAPDATFEHAWRQVLPQLTGLLREGKHLVIHCKGGCGRTGLVVATLLVSFGQPQQEAMTAIQGLHPGGVLPVARCPDCTAGSGQPSLILPL